MREEEGLLDYLVEDIMNDCYEPDDYDPDGFYNEATEFLSVYGYDVVCEVIHEVEGYELEEVEGSHLEVIAGLQDGEGSSFLRFVLEDGRNGEEAPAVDRVEHHDDFAILPVS